jgi:MATE family multidrug resistance protein
VVVNASVVAPASSSELGRTWALAWPASLSFLASQGMAVIDTAMVSRMGAQASAAVAIGGMWWVSAAIVAFGLMRALDPVVAQANGAGDRPAVAAALSNMLALTLPAAALMGGWCLLAAPGLGALGQPAGLLPLAGDYALAMGVATLPVLVFGALRQFLTALGLVPPTTLAVVVGLALKAPLNAWLLPSMGVAGCALATAVAEVAMVAALLLFARGTFREVRPPLPTWSGTRRLLGIGLPIGLQMGTEVWGFICVGLFMGWLGELPLAAHNIAMSAASVSFMIPLGISGAAATRVGTLLGAGESWRPAVAAALCLGAATQLASSLLFLLAPELCLLPYAPPAEVLPLAVALMRVAGVFQLFDGAQVVLFGVLRGAGDVRVPTLANLIGYWLVGLPVAYFAAFELGYGSVGVWAGLSVGLAVVATVLALRLRSTLARGGFRVG